MSSQEAPNAPHVLVGVDGSPNSIKALRAALQEAAWRGVEVHALNAWSYPVVYGMGGAATGYAVDVAAIEQSASAALDQAIVTACPNEPERSTIRRFVVSGSASESLIEESRKADLLVVGARGHGGFLGLLLGSVSSQVVKHAHCPVLVVPPAEVRTTSDV